MGLGEQAEAEIDNIRSYTALDADKIRADLNGVGLTAIDQGSVAGAEALIHLSDRDDLVECGPINVSGNWTAVQLSESRNFILGNTITLTLGDAPIANANSEVTYAESLKKYAKAFLKTHPGIKSRIDDTKLKEIRLVYRIAVPQTK